MRMSTTAVAVAALIAAACGGDDGPADTAPTTTGAAVTTTVTAAVVPTSAPATTSAPPTTAGAQTVVSDDGDVTVDIPAGAAPAGVTPSVRLLDRSEWPESLQGATVVPGVKIYEMEPAGTAFSAPVTVTRRLDGAGFGDAAGPQRLPFVVLASSTADGAGYEPLADATIRLDWPDIHVSGTTTHFSLLLTSFQQHSFELGGPLVGTTECPSSFAPRQGGGCDVGALIRSSYARVDDDLNDPAFEADYEDDVGGWVFQDVDVWLEGEIGDFDWRVAIDFDEVEADPPDECESGFVGRWNVPLEMSGGFDSLAALTGLTMSSLPIVVQVPIVLPCPGIVLTVDLTDFSFGFATSTFHGVIIIGFPSAQSNELDAPAGFPERLHLFTLDCGRGINRDSPVVNVAAVSFTPDQPTEFDLGIECFCFYAFGASPQPIPEGAATVGDLLDNGNDVVLIGDFDTGEPLVVQVGPREATLFDGEARFVPFPGDG